MLSRELRHQGLLPLGVFLCCNRSTISVDVCIKVVGITVVVVLSLQNLTGEVDSRGGGAGGGASWQNVKKMIFVKYNPKTSMAAGHWPIPESFWPDMNTKKLVH